MIRQSVIAAIGSILLMGAPALAQDLPELDGAPGPLRIPPTQPAQVEKPRVAKAPVVKAPAAKPSVVKTPSAKPKPAAPVTVKAATSISKAEQARLAREAEALRVERARLDKQAADLKARQAILDARAAEISAKERGIATREVELAAEQAQLARDTEDVARQLAQATRAEQARKEQAKAEQAKAEQARAAQPAPSPVVERRVEPSERRFGDDVLDHETALDACIAASEDAASVQNFYSVRYDVEPRFYEGRYLQLRGLMRVEDRRGFRILDSLCEVDRAGDVQRFVFLR